MKIDELEQKIENLVKDRTDPTLVQDLLKEKDKEITTLRQKLKMTMTEHVKTTEMLSFQAEHDRLTIENKTHKNKCSS